MSLPEAGKNAFDVLMAAARKRGSKHDREKGAAKTPHTKRRTHTQVSKQSALGDTDDWCTVGDEVAGEKAVEQQQPQQPQISREKPPRSQQWKEQEKEQCCSSIPSKRADSDIFNEPTRFSGSDVVHDVDAPVVLNVQNRCTKRAKLSGQVDVKANCHAMETNSGCGEEEGCAISDPLDPSPSCNSDVSQSADTWKAVCVNEWKLRPTSGVAHHKDAGDVCWEHYFKERQTLEWRCLHGHKEDGIDEIQVCVCARVCGGGKRFCELVMMF